MTTKKSERHKLWRERNRDKLREYQQKYREKNRTRLNETKNRSYKKVKSELINLVFHTYGNKCFLCGENKREVLVLHHTNGGGSTHRKEIGSNLTYLRWIIHNNFPDDIQILCANCHLISHR